MTAESTAAWYLSCNSTVSVIHLPVHPAAYLYCFDCAVMTNLESKGT